jgi:hypothetical protein
MPPKPPIHRAARHRRLIAAAAFAGAGGLASLAAADPKDPRSTAPVTSTFPSAAPAPAVTSVPSATPALPPVTIVPSAGPVPGVTIVPSAPPAPPATIVPSAPAASAAPTPVPEAPVASPEPPKQDVPTPVTVSYENTSGPPVPNTVLLLTGGIAAGLGYVVAIFSAGIWAAQAGSFNSQYGGSCGGAGTSALSLIPLVGPFLTMARYPNHQVASYPPTAIPMQMPYVIDCLGGRTAVQVVAIGEEVLQLGGAGLIGLGLALRSPARPQRGGIVLSPGIAATPAGATLRIDF